MFWGNTLNMTWLFNLKSADLLLTNKKQLEYFVFKTLLVQAVWEETFMYGLNRGENFWYLSRSQVSANFNKDV